MAIKVASKYDRPCLMVRRKEDNEELFGGSGRNIDNTGIDDLKEYLNNTGLVRADGHPHAFGIVELKKENIGKLIELFNKDDSIVQKHFYVDFVVPFEELTDDFIGTLNVLKKHWGKGIKEPFIAIENIDVHAEEVSVIGKEMNTIKINVDGIEFIKFKCDFSEKLMTIQDDFKMNIVGKCSLNEFNGKVTPQIIIEDYEIK
jgi:single-stranded-DNA-specific exonuclease